MSNGLEKENGDRSECASVVRCNPRTLLRFITHARSGISPQGLQSWCRSKVRMKNTWPVMKNQTNTKLVAIGRDQTTNIKRAAENSCAPSSNVYDRMLLVDLKQKNAAAVVNQVKETNFPVSEHKKTKTLEQKCHKTCKTNTANSLRGMWSQKNCLLTYHDNWCLTRVDQDKRQMTFRVNRDTPSLVFPSPIQQPNRR